MKWTQVDVCGPLDLEEIAIACLAGAGCSNVQVIRDEDLPEYDDRWAPSPPKTSQGSPGRPPRVIVRGYLPEGRDPTVQIRDALNRSGPCGVTAGEVAVTISTIEDPGWARSWRKYHRPARIGRRFLVAPSWTKPRPRQGDIVLVIDPGMAFGTGQHATTRLSLQAVERFVKPGDRVVDVGCGSGILSVGAAKMGAEHVLALDTDCVAIATTRENLAVNDCVNVVTVREGSLEPPYPPAEIVVANILAGVVIHLMPAVRECLAKGRGEGVFVASGIITSQEDEVAQAFAAHNMELFYCARSKEWSCMAARLI